MNSRNNQQSNAVETDQLLSSQHPLRELERRAKRRQCLGVALSATFLSLLLGIVIAHVNATNRGAQGTLPEETIRAELSDRAEQSRQRLAQYYGKALRHEETKQQLLNKAHGSCETTLLILRHCEKNGPGVTDADGNEHCSYLGLQRAEYLVSLFVPSESSSARWPAPKLLYAYSPDRKDHWNFRQIETLRPLGAALNLQIDIIKPKRDSQKVDFLLEMIAAGDLCNEVVALSWKHDLIPKLAASLGCGPEQGCPSKYPDESFDDVWQLKYVFHADDISDKEKSTEQMVGSPDGSSGNDNSNGNLRRLLRNSSNKSPMLQPKRDGWYLYGSVTQQNFDPLAFAGDQGRYGSKSYGETGHRS